MLKVHCLKLPGSVIMQAERAGEVQNMSSRLSTRGCSALLLFLGSDSSPHRNSFTQSVSHRLAITKRRSVQNFHRSQLMSWAEESARERSICTQSEIIIHSKGFLLKETLNGKQCLNNNHLFSAKDVQRSKNITIIPFMCKFFFFNVQ